MSGLPLLNCLAVAVTTPVDWDLRPDRDRLIARTSQLLDTGCDGIALFGTTGEGAEFSVEDRMETLDAVLAAGIDPRRLIVSVGALSIPDVVRLTQQATDHGVHGVLLMPPCVYRSGITQDGTFDFFKVVIERVARSALRLYLYHFPDISGVPITPQVIRRLDERYSGMIAGVKDSGGDLEFTEMLVRRFSHLSIFTGTEFHLPEVLASGGRGTICGLANVMPRLLRAMLDLPTAYDRKLLVPAIHAGDGILSRRHFIASTKAVIADTLGDLEWRRVLPPMAVIPTIEQERLVADFIHWDASLPPQWRSIGMQVQPVSDKVVSIRGA